MKFEKMLKLPKLELKTQAALSVDDGVDDAESKSIYTAYSG